MKIAMIGAGRMGRAVEEEARARGHEVVALIGSRDNPDGTGLTPETLSGAEVAIEFTRPDAAPANLLRLADLRVPTVTGTTGWEARLDEVTARVEARGGALLHAANFSVGAHLLVRMSRHLARLLRGREDFDAFLLDHHHREKVDAPSGTALHLKRTLEATDPGREWPVTALRSGWAPGTHALEVDGRHETLSLTHTVRDRRVFAEGALLAAAWLRERRGIHTFDDLFEEEDR